MALVTGGSRHCVRRAVARRAIFAICALIVLANEANAVETPAVRPHPARNFDNYIPTGAAVRIDPGEAPIIDGDPSEAVWQKAELIDEFYQVDPRPGDPASETTYARILYDENTLYVSIYAYDREPEKIIATIRARDGNVDVDDGVRIYIDPALTRRDAYYFEMNALGARVDALLQNNVTYLPKWNTIWQGRAKLQKDGFSVEMAIPFRDMSLNPENGNWGIEVQRRIRRTGERIHWSNVHPAVKYTDVSLSGEVSGISDVSQGLGLDIQLYGKLNYKKDWPATFNHDAFNFVMSGNAYYKITPALTGTLTVNPDFSDSPLDLRQVNTTRFTLFQPETRDFFLQDAAMFEFGGLSYYTSDDIGRENGRPFFSRNIGFGGGQSLSIPVGAKLSGQLGDFGIGALSVTTDGPTKPGETCDPWRSIRMICGQALSVVRVTHPVFQESRLGMIFTNGDPSGTSTNTVAGVDFQYLNSNLFPGKVGQADLFYARSMSNTKGDDDTYGVTLGFPNEPYGGNFHFKQIGPDYSPALGFINRTNIRQYDGVFLRRERRWQGFRFMDLSTSWYVVTDLQNNLQSRENMVEAAVTTPFTDEFHARLFNDFEHVPVPFLIADKVPVPQGRYSWTNADLYIRTSDGRPWSLRGEVLCCSFYNGNQLKMDFTLDWRPLPLIELMPRYTYTFIKLPTGSIGIHLFTQDLIFNFTPDMQLYTQVQFDNISQNFAFSVRYRWEYSPGNELFVLFGQAAEIPEYSWRPRVTQAAVRLGQTFRF